MNKNIKDLEWVLSTVREQNKITPVEPFYFRLFQTLEPYIYEYDMDRAMGDYLEYNIDRLISDNIWHKVHGTYGGYEAARKVVLQHHETIKNKVADLILTKHFKPQYIHKGIEFEYAETPDLQPKEIASLHLKYEVPCTLYSSERLCKTITLNESGSVDIGTENEAFWNISKESISLDRFVNF